MKYIAIELTTPEQYSICGEEFPNITHERIASFNIEIPRPDDFKTGYLDIWLEKGYLNGTKMQLAPGYPGENIKIEEPELFSFIMGMIAAGSVGLELMRVMHTYLVTTDRIDGAVKELGLD